MPHDLPQHFANNTLINKWLIAFLHSAHAEKLKKNIFFLLTFLPYINLSLLCVPMKHNKQPSEARENRAYKKPIMQKRAQEATIAVLYFYRYTRERRLGDGEWGGGVETREVN